MHALKGNLIGQTFAHAKYDDSGERRRSRIRRSKEERKAMVESFIKKHQILNSGSFPSLNLTHKEVGGSFYTVREIIREIIQENKVLGPAKLSQGGENQENILEHYPIGSIAIQPEIDSLSLDAAENELHENPISAYNLSEELPFNTNLEFNESEQRIFADKENISASSLLEKNADEAEVKETLEMEKMLDLSVLSDDKANVREILTTRKVLEESITLEGEATAITTMDTQMGKNLEKLGAFAAEVSDKELEVGGGLDASKDGVNILTKEKNIAELVENLPDVREARTTSIASDLNVETFPVPVSKTIIHGKHDITVTPEQEIDEVVDKMSFTKSPISSQEEDTHLEDKNRMQESEEAHMGISNGYAAKNDHFVDSSSKSDPKVESALHVEIKPLLNEIDNLESSYQKMTHGGGNTEKEHIPTLDRMNLESWKAPAKKSPVQLVDAPLAFLKAIISSFIKFWME